MKFERGEQNYGREIGSGRHWQARSDRWQIRVERLVGVYGFPKTVSWRITMMRVGK